MDSRVLPYEPVYATGSKITIDGIMENVRQLSFNKCKKTLLKVDQETDRCSRCAENCEIFEQCAVTFSLGDIKCAIWDSSSTTKRFDRNLGNPLQRLDFITWLTKTYSGLPVSVQGTYTVSGRYKNFTVSDCNPQDEESD